MDNCHKVQYTREEATNALKGIRKLRKDNKHRRETSVYHCPVCEYWHLTAITEKKNRIKKDGDKGKVRKK